METENNGPGSWRSTAADTLLVSALVGLLPLLPLVLAGLIVLKFRPRRHGVGGSHLGRYPSEDDL